MTRISNLITVLALSALVVTLAACGGSSGGGGGIDPVTYNGPITQATIDANNAADLTALSYTGSELNDVVPLAAAQVGGTTATGSAPVIQTLTDLTRRLPEQLANLPASSPQVAAAIPTTIESCSPDGGITGGGTMTISGAIDETTFSINVTFGDCSDGDTILNGSVQLTGSGIEIDPVTKELIFDNATTNMTFLNLWIEMPAAGESVTVYGTVDMTIDNTGLDPVATQTTNVAMRDNNTGETAMLQNYTVVVTESFPNYQVVISGRVFSSNYGYVDLSTPITLVVDPDTNEPVSGIFRIDGAGDTWAEIDFSSDPAFDQGSYGVGLGVDSVTHGTFPI